MGNYEVTPKKKTLNQLVPKAPDAQLVWLHKLSKLSNECSSPWTNSGRWIKKSAHMHLGRVSFFDE